jgi:hypothetical protein
MKAFEIAIFQLSVRDLHMLFGNPSTVFRNAD